MKCLCPCPLLSNSPASLAPLSTVPEERGGGGELNRAHRAWQPNKDQRMKNKEQSEQQTNTERELCKVELSSDKWRNAKQMLSDHLQFPCDKTHTHIHTQKDGLLCCVLSLCSNQTQTHRIPAPSCPRSVQRPSTEKHDVTSAC